MAKHWVVATCVAAGALAPAYLAARPASGTGYELAGHIAGPDGGWDYATVDPTTGTLYVAHGDAITTVDLASRAVNPVLAPAHHAHQVLRIPGKSELFETDGDTGTTRFVDIATGKVIAEVATGKKPDGGFYDKATDQVVVMNAADGTVSLIDPASHKVTGTIEVGGGLEFGVVDGKGGAYVNVEDRNVVVAIDLKTRKVVKTIALTGCEGPTGLALVGGGTRLISACANDVAVVTDPKAGKVVAKLAIGADPDAVIVDEARHRAFIPNGGSGTLSVLDIAKPAAIRVIGTVKTQIGAKTGAVDPRDGRVYLPTATLARPEPGAKRGKPVPGTFKVLVVAPTAS
ncbi:hypothetical protein LH128_05765 [Sphingomonas sp. LH128]|uniref:YncE family protein n=1 Tax=Sphingomonas sp. LH128 TaxID=473781 RepID=UPI00027CA6D0|nr:YncE family protein [Sphingomonas sp. LH128]EJU14026.1 hypothetical protein LH128_05765 [Sphingomonas sp. LH128]